MAVQVWDLLSFRPARSAQFSAVVDSGSALGGSPTLQGIWFRGGGNTFCVTVKTEPKPLLRTGGRSREWFAPLGSTARRLEPFW